MKAMHTYRNMAYVIICIGAVLALLTLVLPHYDKSHRLVLDIFLLGALAYALYSMLTVLSMRLLLVISVLIIEARGPALARS